MDSNSPNYSTNLPKISIWIAARNEEENIIRCLEAINLQNYPSSQMQVLIGNDQSSDKTQILVENFIQDKPHFQLINIQKTINNQIGKANVLANLYEYSSGDIFLITDADVQASPDWILGMIEPFLQNPKLGHQVGITSVEGADIFTKFQSIDWLLALSLLKRLADWKIPLTGLGNNSAISRAGYEATGGYATIPFSITEDFAMFHAVVNKGYDFVNTINEKVFSKTLPITSLKEFAHQRKRWMVGALQCPAWVVWSLFLQALMIPILLIIAWQFSIKTALILWVFKWLGQTFAVLPTIIKLKQYQLIPHLIWYEFYLLTWGLGMVIFYYLPIKVDWKGRVYN
jgi:1,2-diacylglycerol 3-beta-glucosyltransferase